MASPNRLSRKNFPPGAPARRARNALCALSLWYEAQARAVRFTCVVSKKTARKAVDRNRLKRRCREAVRAHVGRIHVPVTVVAYPTREALTASAAQLKDAVGTLLATTLEDGYTPAPQVR
jgi:ribonuclease P protein component